MARSPTFIALIVATAFFMEILDGTIIATALPQMAVSFHSSPLDLSIGMTAYLLSVTVFIPISGWVADRYGAAYVFGAAIVIFTAASALCGAASGLWPFTILRVLQGFGGALMVPVGRLVVLRSTDKQNLMRAIATITWPALVAPVVGPPVGGFITTFASWRWIFYLNVPIGLLGIVLVARYIDNRRSDQRPPFDAAGFVLSATGLVCLTYGMELVGRAQPRWGLAAALVACSIVVGFFAVRHARVAAHPLISLAPLRVRTYAVTMGGGTLFRIAVNAAPYLLPLMFQVGFGLSAFHAGLLILAGAVANVGMKAWTSPVLRRFGFRSVLVINGIFTAATLAAYALLAPQTPIAVTLVVLFAGGLGRSMQYTALGTLSFADIPPALMSNAATFASMAQQMSSGLGIALGAVLLQIAPLLHGGSAGLLSRGDFRIAFCATALLALAPVLQFRSLAPAAGASVSGHHTRKTLL
jgi:EmrB/QacA subfamily drug resistance transporter